MKTLVIRIADAVILIAALIACYMGFRVGNVGGFLFAAAISVMVSCVWCAMSLAATELVRMREIMEGKQ